MSDKAERHELIKKLIEEENVKTQEELVKRLKENGFKVTQATVSRDVNEIGLVRDDSGYKSAEEKALEDVFRWVNDIKKTGSNLIVTLTEPGTAQTVALAIDKANINGIIGSVAGDDTIFLAVEEDRAQNIMGLLENLKDRQ
jgi:transcriptional regulator of arginine metabolism